MSDTVLLYQRIWFASVRNGILGIIVSFPYEILSTEQSGSCVPDTFRTEMIPKPAEATALDPALYDVPVFTVFLFGAKSLLFLGLPNILVLRVCDLLMDTPT